MLSHLAADALLIVHLSFIVFVVAGGFLVWRWPRLMWIHPPMALWGGLVEFFDWVCPLTPLENRLRRLAGDAGFEGSFIEHYLVPIVYPPGLNRTLQIALGAAVVLVNAAAYLLYFRCRRRRDHVYSEGQSV